MSSSMLHMLIGIIIICIKIYSFNNSVDSILLWVGVGWGEEIWQII